MSNNKSHYINNIWKSSYSTPFISLNPATGKVLWEGEHATSQTINEAVKSAKNASQEWMETPIETRIGFLESFHDLLIANKKEFAETISSETGKPLWESLQELDSMIGKLSISISSYYERCKELKTQHSNGLSITRHVPQGVVAVFSPFNLPGHIPCTHIIPALLGGNTIVYKPSELTPKVAEYLTTCWEEVGLPEGVFNLVQGGQKTGKILSMHPDIDGLFFTGSYGTGRLLSAQFGKNPDKILTLEMGGNNPLIVNSVIDIPTAIYLIIQSAFITSGQRCTCARRLIIIESIQSQYLIESLLEAVQEIKIAPYTDVPEPFMGPVISESAAIHLIKNQEFLMQMGAKPLLKLKHFQEGTGFVTPGIIDVTDIPRHYDEEFFGPLLQLIRVKSLDDAIRVANETKFGLTAGIFSEDKNDFLHVLNHVKAGVINWNTALTGLSGAAPFGGVGKSGNHRPTAYYAVDYCSHPVTSLEKPSVRIPEQILPGLEFIKARKAKE